MYPIISLVVFVLDIIAIVDCAKSSMDGGKKVLWIILILLLPLLGLILYYLVGRKSAA